MDYTQIQTAKVAGTVTVAVIKEEVIPVMPNDERLTVTVKKFDPYTGAETIPEVQAYRKTDLLREIDSINQQKAKLDERKKSIEALLAEFAVVTTEKPIIETVEKLG